MQFERACLCVCMLIYFVLNFTVFKLKAADVNIKVESESCSVVSNSLRPHELYSPWKSPGQNTGMGSLSLLQGIFPTQRSKPSLPHCRQILYQLSHKGSLNNTLEGINSKITEAEEWINDLKNSRRLCPNPSIISDFVLVYPLDTCKFFPCSSAGKESACNAGDLDSISGLGRSPGEGKGYPFQCCGLENSMDCNVRGVAKNQTQLSDFHFHLDTCEDTCIF